MPHNFESLELFSPDMLFIALPTVVIVCHGLYLLGSDHRPVLWVSLSTNMSYLEMK